MIPKASQRAGGDELATHLLNAQQNERIEVVEIRGAVARDPHGAFAEWQFQARALTRCKKYLYSLSINPDPRLGEFTREQYADYINRVEKSLGLSGQPRALIFHEKQGRLHAHVVWSRVDVKQGKAIHISYDHMKLKQVTLEFARDHGLELPDGYFKKTERKRERLYDRLKQNDTGLSLDDHRELVTEAWRISDSPRAFVRALEERGYLLATGKRPYVLVDVYGHSHALQRLIDEDQIRTKDLRQYMEKDFPIEDLPSVEQAQAMVEEFDRTRRELAQVEQREEAMAELKAKQAPKRAELTAKFEALEAKLAQERLALEKAQRVKRENRKAAFRAREKFIKLEREARRPRGLAAFLGKVTGINLVRTKFHKYHDRKRLREFLAEKERLKAEQAAAREALKQQQLLQKRVLEREERALKKIEKEQRRTLEQELRKEQRINDRGGGKRMPPIKRSRGKDLGEKDALVIEANTASGIRTKLREQRELAQEFTRVAAEPEDDGGGGGGHGPTPEKTPDPPDRPRGRRRKRSRGKGFDRGM